MAVMKHFTFYTLILGLIATTSGQVAPPDPRNDKALLNQLKNIKSTEDFLKNLKIDASDIEALTGVNATLSAEEIEEGKLIPTTASDALASVLSVQARCEPRDMEIEIPRDDPMVFVWPSCIKAKRCGGCCGHEMLVCAPDEAKGISETKVKVMKASYPTMGASSFKYSSVQEISIETHTACECRCRVQEKDCHRNQEYIPTECRCKCQDKIIKKCSRSKKWDDNVCACVCKKVYDCGTYESYDWNVCRCTYKRMAKDDDNNENFEITENKKQPNSPTTDPHAACQASLRCPDGFVAISEMTGCACKPASVVNKVADTTDNGNFDLGGDNFNLDLGKSLETNDGFGSMDINLERRSENNDGDDVINGTK